MRRPLVFLLAAATGACREPTQVTVEIWTDLFCDEGLQADIRAGRLLQDLETAPPVASTKACHPSGRVGSLVLVPESDDEESVAIKVTMTYAGSSADPLAQMLRKTMSPEICARNNRGLGCIVARRALHFVPHSKLLVPILMRRSTCEDVLCPPSEACVDGVCRSATVPDPALCLGSGCPESVLGAGADGGTSGDAGGDVMSDRRLDAPVIVPCQPQAARCNNGQREVCDGAGRWQVEREPCAVTAGLAAGPAHTCALRIDGRVKCWGINEFGQLGIGDQNNRGDGPGEMGARLPAVDLGMGRFATAIATGSSHSCAILDNAQVKCWGSNRSGQLGIGQNPPLGDPYENRGDNPDEMGDQLPEVDLGQGRSAIAIALGRAHTCALLDNRELKCWGANGAGQLGIGDTVDRGKKPEEMGDALPAVRFGSGLAFDVKAGEDHTCAIIDGNAVHCWGSNFGGVLGLGDTRDRGGSPSDLGPNLPRVDFGSDANGPLEALILATGPFHNCVYLTNHELKCWGRNAVGELGLNDTRPRGALPGDMGSMLPATLTLRNDDVTQLALGYNHTCASVNQDLECWGSNLSGQLGISGRSQLGGEPDDIPLSLRPVELGPGRIGVITAAGSQHTCALLDDFRIKCWGANQHGELGLEDTLPRFIEPGQGDKLPAVDLGP